MIFRRLFCAVCLSIMFPAAYAIDSLKVALQNLTSSYNAKAGIAVMDFSSGDSVSLYGEAHFPMQSVFKFHLALAILHQVDEGKLHMDQPVVISKDRYYSTWSPLMRKYPEGATVPLREVIWHTASESDNIGCDLLFELAGGTAVVNDYIHNLGVTEVAILNTEKELHIDQNLQFQNFTTPHAMMGLIAKVFQEDVLSKSSRDFLWQTMVECPTGNRRLKGLLPEGTTVAHKTGSSDSRDEVIAAVNDAGIIVLPDGKRIGVVVFVTEGRDNFDRLQKLIAEVGKAVYDHYLSK